MFDLEKKINDWKKKDYEIIIYYLKLPSVKISIERVKLRISQGGHFVSEDDIRRRFPRSWQNFENIYKLLADSWAIYDTSGKKPIMLEQSE